MHTYLKQTLLTLFLLASIPPLSYADFNVIPVVKKVNTLITVAKSGGEFNDIVAAIASVTDASADNPYVVYVAPGIYTVGLDQQIVIKDYVSLIGSGIDATAIINLKSYTVGSTNSSYAIMIINASPTVQDVNAAGNGSSGFNSEGIYLSNSSPRSPHPASKNLFG